MQQMSGKHADLPKRGPGSAANPFPLAQLLTPTLYHSCLSGPHPLQQPQLPSTSASSAFYASPSLRFPSKTELPAPAALFRSQRIPAAMAKPCPLPQPQPTLALYQSLWHLPSTSATAALLASPSSC
ncbi:hypothetical protein PCANC_24645 [Puccinia coronata f. sp. avenae]|uniref:Uncharacterized protein n=1 Tax=Puccinia coronata f. sp. avenae TaxID=200324 RepID=A0A2N5U4K0_9BASI|nr:hypothetical protein PCANC_24645 [Puccinia coronata f. sp. avenae]